MMVTRTRFLSNSFHFCAALKPVALSSGSGLANRLTRSAMISVACALGVLLSECATGVCDDTYIPPAKRVEVEVGPGKFINVIRCDWTVDDPRNRSSEEKTRLTVEYAGKSVTWEGREIPIVLREKDKRLYLAGYDRETGRLNGDGLYRFAYFHQNGEMFEPLKREDFPKELATQNMWLRRREDVETVLNLDTSNPSFRRSVNALLWQHLLTGEPASEYPNKALLDDFVAKFKPVPLSAIKKAAINAGN